MNKFFALLKDSYREAVSTWVLQVMLGLSVLLMLFVASVSFRQISLQDKLDNSLEFSLLNFAARSNPDAGKAQYLFEKVESTNPNEPWNSNYAFDVVIRTDSVENFKKLTASTLPKSRSELRGMLKEILFFLDKVQVEEMKPADAATQIETRFHVTSTGTKAPDRMAWPHEPTIFFAWELPSLSNSLREGVYSLQKKLINDVGAWVTLLVTIIVTAGFIPNLLRKGYLDLYISKPIGWVELLLYKYIGGLLFVFIITAFTTVGIWLIIGARTGIWSPQFLLLIPMLVFYFAILYSVSTFVAVLTRSGMLAILATVIIWGLAFGFGYFNDLIRKMDRARDTVQQQLKVMQPNADDDELPENIRGATDTPSWQRTLVTTGHAVLPRTYDLDDQMIHIIANGVLTDAEKKQKGLNEPIPKWWITFGASSLFIAVMLGLACWRFSSRDG